MNLKVVLARVVPTTQMMLAQGDYAFPRYQEVLETIQEEAEGYLKLSGEKMREKGVSSVEERRLMGYTATSLIDLAKETEGSMVAMTTHGRSGIGRWLLGSVADRVVHHAESPVLLVRTN